MKDTVVYVHPDLTSDNVDILTPKKLDAMLDDGWRIKERSRQKVSGKMVDVYHLQMREQKADQAVVVRKQPEERDEMGVSVRKSGSELMTSTNQSFLGTSDFQGLPGIHVANSKLLGHADSLGSDAAHQGRTEQDCPWEPGTAAATQWLRGFKAAVKAMGGVEAMASLTKEAYENGKQAGTGDSDIEVHCPYPQGTAYFNEWLRGFKEAGGKVE